MAPSAYLSLVLAPVAKAALQTCINHIQTSSPVPLDPMSASDMHMTLVFLGSNIRGLTPAKHSELSSLISGFGATASTTPLEFNRLELFPPAKRNLLIARYKIGDGSLVALRTLQAACFELGLVSKEEYARWQQDEEFVAHVTLGKFRGMKAEQITAVERIVRKVSEELQASVVRDLELPFDAACLCGAA